MTIRYELIQQDIKFLMSEKNGEVEVKIPRSQDKIFVNVNDITSDWARLTLYYSDGNIVSGWVSNWYSSCPVKILHYKSLLDGRFNA